MKYCINDYLRVKFDAKHNKVVKVGDIELIRPDKWLHKDGDEEKTSTFEENTNYLETKPQICEVLASNPKYPYKPGDRLFVHYMAWEAAQDGDIVTNEAYILAEFVFFTIMPDGTLLMAKDNYIGEQVKTPEVVRPSGIIIDIGGKKEALQAKITHVPEDSICKPGDTVVTIDRYNYPLNYEGKEYIRVKSSEIVGTKVN